MTSNESTENEVWLSGAETIRFANELMTGPIDPRATGRSIRLALKYVELSLKVAPCRIQIEDHHPDGDYDLSNIVRKIFNAINIDYKIQGVPSAEKDPDSFTGIRHTGKKIYFLTAEPKGLKAGDYEPKDSS